MRARRLVQDANTKKQNIVWFGSYGVVPVDDVLETYGTKDSWGPIEETGDEYHYSAQVNLWVGKVEPAKKIIATVGSPSWVKLTVSFIGINGRDLTNDQLTSERSGSGELEINVNELAERAKKYDLVTGFKITVSSGSVFNPPVVSYPLCASSFVPARAEWANTVQYVTPPYGETVTFNYSSGQESVKDGLVPRLSVIKGELWYKKSYGLPLMEKIKSKGIYDSIIVNYMMEYPDVANLVDFSSYLDGHSYVYDTTIMTVFGGPIRVSSE